MALKARITLITLALLGVFLLEGCNSEENSEIPAEELEEVALQIISDGTFQYSEKGEVKNVLMAGRLERWESDGESSEVWRVSEGFTLFIEGDKHKSEAVLKGGRGIYDANKGHLIAYDDVELVNNENERLRTEYLVWSNDSDRVHTNRPVSIITKSGTLHGKGLEADSKFENYRIIDPTGEFDLQ
jgi:LPS export ABC transporter protein LptC